MDTEKLQRLMAVLETGSLSGAAEKLSYTPSGISRTMEALEEEFGFRLLVRGKEGVRPTRELESLLPGIRSLIAGEESLRQKAADIRGLTTGTVVIGCSSAGMYEKLEERIAGFRKTYPGIRFQIRSGFTSELLAMMEERTMDLCICTVREGLPSVTWHEIGRDEMILWVPKEHPLGSRKALPLDILAHGDYIDIYPGRDIDNSRILAERGVKPSASLEAMDSYTAYSMVRAGLGIAMNSRLNTVWHDEKVREIPLDPAYFLPIGIAAGADLSPAAQRFLSCLLEKGERQAQDAGKEKMQPGE